MYTCVEMKQVILTQVWLGRGGIKRSIQFLSGIPGWWRKKGKPSTAKRENQLTDLGLAQQINENRI